jgi:hypothetical protein
MSKDSHFSSFSKSKRKIFVRNIEFVYIFSLIFTLRHRFLSDQGNSAQIPFLPVLKMQRPA